MTISASLPPALVFAARMLLQSSVLAAMTLFWVIVLLVGLCSLDLFFALI